MACLIEATPRYRSLADFRRVLYALLKIKATYQRCDCRSEFLNDVQCTAAEEIQREDHNYPEPSEFQRPLVWHLRDL